MADAITIVSNKIPVIAGYTIRQAPTFSMDDFLAAPARFAQVILITDEGGSIHPEAHGTNFALERRSIRITIFSRYVRTADGQASSASALGAQNSVRNALKNENTGAGTSAVNIRVQSLSSSDQIVSNERYAISTIIAWVDHVI